MTNGARLAQCVLDTCVLLEVTASSVAGCTWLAGPAQSDEIKALTILMRNLFEDSKQSRPAKDTILDPLMVDWTYSVAHCQKFLRLCERPVVLDDAVSKWANASQLAALSNTQTACLESACDLLAGTVLTLLKALQSKCAASLEKEEPTLKCELNDEQLNDPETARFAQVIAEELAARDQPKTVEWLAAGLDSAQGFDAVSRILHDLVRELTYRHRVANYNSGIAKAPKKKLGLKLGKGVTLYVEQALPAYGEDEERLARILSDSAASKQKPKAPKGCVDFRPHQVMVRETVLEHIKNAFKLFGAVPIDTPVFELKDVLTNKYGEDSKLIYDLKDQGGEKLALRYDLTVPFARYCATNGIERIKRYHIGKVYRRDEPALNRGRYREFYQCDVDFAGPADCMVSESEILTLTCHILDSLKTVIGSYAIKLSHRSLLDGIMAYAGVPEGSIRAISSAIDKLDKEPWEAVEKEMVDVKHLDPAVAQRLKGLVQYDGSIPEVSRRLVEDFPDIVTQAPAVGKALEELQLLHAYLEPAGVAGRVCFATSLARGLDYYTGLIYEVVMIEADGAHVGSIAAGGRYDNLIGMFANKQIPAVGISLGIERIFRLIESKCSLSETDITSPSGEKVSLSPCQCYVASVGQVPITAKMEVAARLRSVGVSVEFSLKQGVNFKKELQHVLDLKIPVAVILGEAEWTDGQRVKVRAFSESGRGEEHESNLDALPAAVHALLKPSSLGSVLFS